MIQTCHHVMPNGLHCQSPAMRGYAFCYHHARRITSKPHGKPLESAIAMPAQLDRQGIQTALNSILQGLASGRVSTRRAGILLYGLQMATARPSLPGPESTAPVPSSLEWAELLTPILFAPKDCGDAK